MSLEPLVATDSLPQDPPVDSPPGDTRPPDAPGERLWAGKFKAPEVLEESYENLQTQHTTVTRENELLRAELERKSQPQPAPTAAGPLDNSAVTAQAQVLMDQGRYLEANQLILKHGMEQLRRELGGDLEGVKRTLTIQTADSAVAAMAADKVRFPNLDKLNTEMAGLAKSRLSATTNPEVIVSAYGGYPGFFKALYYEVEGQHPELRRGGAALPAGALTPGGGGTPRPRTAPVPPSGGTPKSAAKYKASLRALGLPDNVYQNDRSSFDRENAAKWAQLEALNRQAQGLD